ncbi:hypothetical protein K456DRAFT_53241 [Colletotrichum gloeosporioides 23]|nr:hypothetical protein K456DRAFT_53241 [Colletotrichum gloeosporioides 23]
MSSDLLSQMLSVPSQVWGSDPSVSSGRRKYGSRVHVGKNPKTTSAGAIFFQVCKAISRVWQCGKAAERSSSEPVRANRP